MKKSIRMICLFLALLMLWSCTPVEMETESSSSAAPIESEIPEESSESSPTTEESKDEDSSVYTEVYVRPEILDKSYAERAEYFGQYYEMEYDLNDAYFHNSVFVGNSIMLHFSNFVTRKRASDAGFLGKAQFFAAASFSFYNNANQTASSPDCALPLYAGTPMSISDAVGEMKIGTVYLSLMALNDIAIYSDGMTGILETYNLFVDLVEDLNEKYPATEVVVLSNTYLHSSGDNGRNKLNNGSISDLNIRVLDYCNQNGLDFIDVSSVLLDDGKCLGTEFCSDIGSASFACHLTKYAYNAWTFVLRDYAAAKQKGIWKNPESMEGLLSQ